MNLYRVTHAGHGVGSEDTYALAEDPTTACTKVQVAICERNRTYDRECSLKIINIRVVAYSYDEDPIKRLL